MEEHYQSKFNLTLGLEFAKVKSGKSERWEDVKVAHIETQWQVETKS